MNQDYRDTANWLKDRLPSIPEIAVILGTGLNNLAEKAENKFIIPYTEIPGFAASTAPSHKGNLIWGELNGKPVLFLQGRFHFYEGYPMSVVVYPTRVLACLGIKNLIVTNASGSLREAMAPGSLVVIRDHINFMGTNPLIGHNDDSLGERFPSMNNAYDQGLIDLCDTIARENNITLQQGIYLAVSGPSLETKAECAAFAGWGADLVGMSTVPEVIAARHAGLRVLTISVVTNYSNLFHDDAHSQAEIQHNAVLASDQLTKLISQVVNRA